MDLMTYLMFSFMGRLRILPGQLETWYVWPNSHRYEVQHVNGMRILSSTHLPPVCLVHKTILVHTSLLCPVSQPRGHASNSSIHSVTGQKRMSLFLKAQALLHDMLHDQLSSSWCHCQPSTFMPSSQKEAWELCNWPYEGQPAKGIRPQPHPHPMVALGSKCK